MKRTHDNVKGDAKNNVNGGTVDPPKPKKLRRARLSRKKFAIAPLDEEQNRRFILENPIRECMDKLDADGLMAKLRAGENVPKPVIHITNELDMFIHNVVLTTELYEDPTRCASYDAHTALQERLSLLDTEEEEEGLARMPAGERERQTNIISSLQLLEDVDFDAVTPFDKIAGMELASEHSSSEEDDDFQIIEDFASASDPTVKYRQNLQHPSVMAPKPPLASDNKGSGSIQRYYEVPLRKLNYYLRHYGPQFNPRRFTAVIIRNDELSAASLVFGSVKIVCTGCSRIELALYLMNNTLDKLRAAGYNGFLDPTPCLRNIVSGGRFGGSVPRQICTNLMTVLYSNRCARVEQFPGTMIYDRAAMGRRVMLIFATGEMCHSGAQSPEEIHHDVTTIAYPMILRCVRNRKNAKDDAECARLLSMDPESATTIEAMRTFRARFANVPDTSSNYPVNNTYSFDRLNDLHLDADDDEREIDY